MGQEYLCLFWKWKGNSLWEDRASADPGYPVHTGPVLIQVTQFTPLPFSGF